MDVYRKVLRAVQQLLELAPDALTARLSTYSWEGSLDKVSVGDGLAAPPSTVPLSGCGARPVQPAGRSTASNGQIGSTQEFGG